MDKECKVNISKNLCVLLDNNGLTKKAADHIFGLTEGSFSKYTNNNNYPKMETLVEIAEHFNVSLDELIIGHIEQNIDSGLGNHLRQHKLDSVIERRKAKEKAQEGLDKDHLIQVLQKQLKQLEGSALDKIDLRLSAIFAYVKDIHNYIHHPEALEKLNELRINNSTSNR